MSAALRIGEVARCSDMTPDTLRYYERLGLIEPAGRTPGGYRTYGRAVIDRLAFIRKAQALGLTLDEVSDVLRASTEGAAPCEHVRATLTKRLLEVDARMADLRALRRTLEAALDWSRELPLAESCVCGIIESQPMPATKPLPAFRHRRSASR